MVQTEVMSGPSGDEFMNRSPEGHSVYWDDLWWLEMIGKMSVGDENGDSVTSWWTKIMWTSDEDGGRVDEVR